MFQGLSVWAIIETGGPTMYVLLACSVLSVSVIVERIICYWLNSAVTRSAFLAAIGKALKRGGREDALAVCAKVRTASAGRPASPVRPSTGCWPATVSPVWPPWDVSRGRRLCATNTPTPETCCTSTPSASRAAASASTAGPTQASIAASATRSCTSLSTTTRAPPTPRSRPTRPAPRRPATDHAHPRCHNVCGTNSRQRRTARSLR